MRYILLAAALLLSSPASAQWRMVNPGAYGYGPFHWGSGRYWGSWGGFAPGPRYYNYGSYGWGGFSRWRYGGY